MRRRRYRSYLILVIKSVATISIVGMLWMYLSNTNEPTAESYNSVWEEYFKRANQRKKPLSPEIVEKLKEGMSRLGNRYDALLYIKRAMTYTNNTKLIKNKSTDILINKTYSADANKIREANESNKDEELSRSLRSLKYDLSKDMYKISVNQNEPYKSSNGKRPPNNSKIPSSSKVAKYPYEHFDAELKQYFLSNQALKRSQIIEDGIYWSESIERQFKRGLSDEDVSRWASIVRHQAVREMHPPNWKECGRPKNQLIIMDDGTRICARYRHPHIELVQGELYSFWMSRLLGMEHVPAVVLSIVNHTSVQWKKQMVGISNAGWQQGVVVGLVQWIDNLERDRMPRILLDVITKKSAENDLLHTMSTSDLVELLQWSDLIVFDYIIGNYDRVANNQDAATKENRPSIMSEYIHNLKTNKRTNSIWLIDNESGLIDGYELMRNPHGVNEASRFVAFHQQMLNSICIFRKSTVANIERLHSDGNPASLLLETVHRNEPLAHYLPAIPKRIQFASTLKRRISDVYDRIRYCRSHSRSVISEATRLP